VSCYVILVMKPRVSIKNGRAARRTTQFERKTFGEKCCDKTRLESISEISFFSEAPKTNIDSKEEFLMQRAVGKNSVASLNQRHYKTNIIQRKGFGKSSWVGK